MFASMAGWAYPMSRAEMYSAALLQKVANALRDEGSEPLEIDWPWSGSSPAVPAVSSEEAAGLKADLRANSAFAQIRTPEAMPSINE